MNWYRYAAAVAFVEAGVAVSSKHHVWGFAGCVALSMLGFWLLGRDRA